MSPSRRVTTGLVGVLIVGQALVASGTALGGVPPAGSGPGGGNAVDASIIQSIEADPTTKRFAVVQLDPEAVSPDRSELALEIGGHRLDVTQHRSELTPSGNLLWYGSVGAMPSVTGSALDPLSSAILVRDGERVTGTIRDDGQLYRLRPLPSGDHVLLEVDESQMPPDHPEDFADLPVVSMNQGNAVADVVDIRVLVVATEKAEDGYGGDLTALIELAVAETNEGYLNSDVDIHLELAAYTTTDYRESGLYARDLARFRNPGDGRMDEIHALRDETAADVAMLVLDNGTSCGLASSIGSKPRTAFAAVYWDCATGYYSFGHEIGHLQGARHDPWNDPSDKPFRFGHGYQHANAWRTIMAYDCERGCPRLNYWSNPDVKYHGKRMGTARLSDNHRVLETTKETIGDFR